MNSRDNMQDVLNEMLGVRITQIQHQVDDSPCQWIPLRLIETQNKHFNMPQLEFKWI